MILLLASWIPHDGECIITYYYDLITKNNEEKRKEDTDIDLLISTNSALFKVFFVITTFTTIYCIYIASIRSNIMSTQVTLLYLIIRYLYVFYNNAVGYNLKSSLIFIFGGKIYEHINEFYKNTNIKKTLKPYLNNVILFIDLIILIYVVYKNYKRF